MDINATLELHTGRRMPVLGLGTWQLDRDTAAIVEEALHIGYRMIDTSGDYGTQAGVGQAIRRSALPREQVYLVTKVEENEDAYDATRRNLDELGLDFVDLMLIHRPPPFGAGVSLWEGLIRARDDGLARDIGVSNYSIAQISQLAESTGEVPAVNQVEWTPFGWSQEMLDFARQQHLIIQAYSPLTRARRLNDERLGRIAAAHGKTPAQALLRWDLQLGVAPLPKANQRHHLSENLAVFDFELSEGQRAELDALNEQWSSLGTSLQYA
jgi:2,5-diketo-D-gluconate reductase A